ncbi:MAG: hypothetical protein FJ051_00540 [Cyanobacteria bacterium M_surface_9_m1_291]|nr:hypothetical protein [Cyanobacteria bacterium M_surface_9_m1_291]
MRDLFLDGLPILDALEVSGSTAATARWINCDQSSVSRAYRKVSAQLDLHFNKDDGAYQAKNNQALLASLRHASQLRRLAAGVERLQWLHHADVPLPKAALPPPQPLACSWRQEQRSIDLLQRRVLDLALVVQPALPTRAAGGGAIQAIRIAPHHGISALVLDTLSDHASITGLIRRLSALLHPL